MLPDLPLEVIQIIKEYCDLETAQDLTMLGIGFLTFKEKVYNKASYLYYEVERAQQREFPHTLWKGRCDECADWSVGRTWKWYVIHKLVLGSSPMWYEILSLDYFDQYYQSIYQGPLLPICPHIYRQKFPPRE